MSDLKNGPCMSRRTFLAAAAAVGAAAFLYSNAPAVAAAIEKSGKKVVWLRGSGCGGCTASILNGGNPEILAALGKISLGLEYHDGLMAQQGVFVDGSPAGDAGHNSNVLLDGLIDEGGYVLIVEGAIPNGPEGSGRYCMSGAVPFKQVFMNAAPAASCIIALGTCASYGGVSRSLKAADATGVSFSGTSRLEGAMARYGLHNTVINVPGCPPNPDWLLLTLADVLSGVEVDLDVYDRPKAFFGSMVHDSCPRRGAFDRAARDDWFAGGNCLYNLGCKGMLAFADCPSRRWNDGAGMCTHSGGPCVACVEPAFPDAFMPFFTRVEGRGILEDVDVDTAAKIIIGASVIGAGIHAVKRLAIGESGREDEKGGKR